MVSAEVIRRFVAPIKEKHSKINEPAIEKDFYLTLLLNEMSRSIEENKDSPFRKLVFKGGTLLTRTHLNYHRISEDLDFTYAENKRLNHLSSKQRKKVISHFTSQLVEEISEISKKFGLEFSSNKSNKKYCRVMDRKKVYLFRIYYHPVYGTEEYIKFEVNFNDELIYKQSFENIRHLFDADLIKDLEFIEGIKIRMKKNIPCYDLREVAVEKIRAILTRPAIKERDLFDLFLISKKVEVQCLKKENVIKKIISTKSFVKELPAKIQKSIETLGGSEYSVTGEKDKLALIDIKEKEYSDFKRKVIPLIIKIGKKAIESL